MPKNLLLRVELAETKLELARLRVAYELLLAATKPSIEGTPR